MLRNGKTYNPENMPDMEVIDDNIVRHIGMTRIPSKNKTPFQNLISSSQSFFKEEKFDHLAQKLFAMPVKGKLFSAKDEPIIDAYNDNFKRFFESLFAKKLLTHTLNSKHIEEIQLLIKEITTFLTQEHKKYNPDFLDLWEAAKKNVEVKNDDLNNSFRVFRVDLKKLIEEDHFQDKKSETIINLYDLHYLAHPISHLASYKTQYPKGIVEIYDNNYKKRHRYFLPLNRGRIAGFGFNKDNPSYHLGLFRSSDPTPGDMRKSTLTSNATRCPDRLYMEHPKVARTNANNWLNRSFSNEYNSCYVNGLSGSALLEIRSLLFFILSIKNKHYSCQFMKEENLFKDNHRLLKDYFRLILGLFVYFEGGHAFSEILSVFDLKDVLQQINETLQNKTNTNIFSVQALLMNEDILHLMQESFKETAQFYSVCRHKAEMHKDLEHSFLK